MKKGFLFTVITIFLLSSLFSLSGYYLARRISTQDLAVSSTLQDKMNFLETDIAASYFDISGIQINRITRQTQLVNISFNMAYTVPNTIDIAAAILNYKSFVEGGYAAKTNSQIVLGDFTPAFVILPFGTIFNTSKTLYIYTPSPGPVKNIYIDARIDASENPPDSTFSTSAPTDDGAGYPLVKVIIRDANEAILLEETRQLNPSETNNAFHVQLDHTGNPPPPSEWVDIEFGLITGKPASLIVNRYLLETTVKEIHLGYAPTADAVYLNTSSAIINLKIGGFRKVR